MFDTILVVTIPASLLLALTGAVFAASPAPTPAAASPSFKKVMIVIFENTTYQDALSQPFFTQLSTSGALLADFYAETHPSQPNYIALISGGTQGVASDSNVDLDARHVGDLLEAGHKTWKVYVEGYPGNCFLRRRSGKYVRKHVPFLSFKSVSANPGRCAHIVEASALDSDIQDGSLPDYSLYIPDMYHDGHETDPAAADQWFAKAFGPRLNDPRFMKDMLLVATFDEDDMIGSNHIYTALYGAGVAPGSVARDRYDHYSLLRTIEDALGLGTLGANDASASPIAGVWK